MHVVSSLRLEVKNDFYALLLMLENWISAYKQNVIKRDFLETFKD